VQVAAPEGERRRVPDRRSSGRFPRIAASQRLGGDGGGKAGANGAENGVPASAP
jgi:hypothetical protein